jgi:hypothetical protein
MAYYTIHAEVTVPVEVIVAADNTDDAVERFRQRSWLMVKKAAWHSAKAQVPEQIHELPGTQEAAPAPPVVNERR